MVLCFKGYVCEGEALCLLTWEAFVHVKAIIDIDGRIAYFDKDLVVYAPSFGK